MIEERKQRPRRPSDLTDDNARRYWETHLPILWDNGTLSERDVASFVVLCEVYGKVRLLSSIPYDPKDIRTPTQLNNYVKQYTTLAARFGVCGPGSQGRSIEAKAMVREQVKPERNFFTAFQELTGEDHPRGKNAV